MKNKAFTAYRDEIVKDINHEAWAKGKRKIIEIPDDKIEQRDEQTIVVYDDVVRDANYVAYRMGKKRIIDPKSDSTPTDTKSVLVYDKVMKDVNFAAYKVNKERVVDEIRDDTQANLSSTIIYEDVVRDADFAAYRDTQQRIKDFTGNTTPAEVKAEVVYSEILEEANFAAYKANKRRITEATDDDKLTSTKNTITVYYNNALRDSNHAAFKADKKRITGFGTPLADDKTLSIVVDRSNTLDTINFEAYKIRKQHVTETNERSSSSSITLTYSTIISDINRVSWRVAGIPVVRDANGTNSTSFTLKCNNIKKDADTISWKVANCRIDDAEARFDVQMDNSSHDTDIFSKGYTTAIGNIYRNIAFFLKSSALSDSPTDHTFSYDFDTRWNGSVETINLFISRYVLNYTLYEWFKHVMPTEADKYLAEAQLIMNNLVEEAKSDYTNDSWIQNKWKEKIAELNDILRNYLAADVAITSGQDASFAITFNTKWMGSINAVSEYMRRFVVDGILKDWFAIVLPDNDTYLKDQEVCRVMLVDELLSEESGSAWYERTFSSASATICSALKMFLISTPSNTDGMEFNIKLLKGSIINETSIIEAIKLYTEMYILGEWLALSNDELAAKYKEEAGAMLLVLPEMVKGEVDNNEWFDKTWESAISQVRDKLRTLLKLYTEQGEQTDKNVSLILHLPATWRGNTASLENYINNFTVDFILREWFTLNVSDISSHYTETASSWMEKITSEAYSEETNTSWLESTRATAIKTLRDDLSEYLSISDTKEAEDKTKYTLFFKLSPTWRGDSTILNDYAKNYLVNYILHQWFVLTATEYAEKYAAEAQLWHDRLVEEAKSEDANSMWLASVYASALARLKDDLRFCIKLSDTAAQENYTFSFRLSPTWRGSIESLTKYLHNYTVSYILNEWAATNNLATREKYTQNLTEWHNLIIAEANSEDENTEWFNRMWEAAISQMKDELRFFLTLSDTGSVENDKMPNYTFNFHFSDSWRGSIEALSNYIHHYVVDYILNAWFSLTSPEHSKRYAETVKMWAEKIVSEAKSEDKNDTWFKRMWETAISQVKDKLRPYIYLDDSQPSQSDYTFKFRFSPKWRGSASALSNYIHRYIVDYILGEWFRMNEPKEAGAFITNTENWMQKITAESHSEEENYEWFERMLATAVDHLKGSLRWCIREHLGTITDNTIKRKSIAYGDEGNPAVGQDATSFEDDEAFLDAPAEIELPIPEHIFRFAFSDEWRGNFEAMGNYIHRYIVDYILYEWFKMTLPDEAATYLASATEWETKIINEARSEDVRNVYFRL